MVEYLVLTRVEGSKYITPFIKTIDENEAMNMVESFKTGNDNVVEERTDDEIVLTATFGDEVSHLYLIKLNWVAHNPEKTVFATDNVIPMVK